MAFRLQLTPQAVRVLSCCKAAVRELVLHELGATLTGPLLRASCQRLGEDIAGACSLPSGVQVRYVMDEEHGLLLLLELRVPQGSEEVSATTP